MTTTMTRELPVKLTDEERQAKGAEIARALEEYDRTETEKKIATKDLTDRMKDLRRRSQKLARQLREGTERQVEITEDRNFRTGTVREIRTDTDEVVATRAMTTDERKAEQQLTMFPGGGAKRTSLRNRVLDTSRVTPGPLSKRTICELVTGRDADIRRMVDALVAEGVLTETSDGFAVPAETPADTKH